MGAKRSFQRTAVVGLLATSLFVGLTAVAASGAATRPKASGTVIFAEGPGANPNYIFPYESCTYFSVDNINQFQELMYRPLYYFGLGGSVAVQPALSLAALPKASAGNKTYTITLKGWKWSNGTTVDAQSVALFLNMYAATANTGDYCGANPGYGIPYQVKSVSYPKGLTGDEVVMNFSTAVNPYWILYNYFSEITPFPVKWDTTNGSNAAGCSTQSWTNAVNPHSSANATCTNVVNYLQGQASTFSNFTSSFWQISDGPYKLSSFDSLGDATFVPNSSYSGPQKSLVAQVDERAYSSETGEESDLDSDSIQLGYVDPSELPNNAPAPGKVGSNVPALAADYTLTTVSPWSFNYAPWNFSSVDAKHAAIAQLYIRQAMQEAINQDGILDSVNRGYGYPTIGPVPPAAPTSLSAKLKNPYPYSATKAKALLTSHGWVEKSGVDTCESATKCGAGIGVGYTLSFNFVVANGVQSLTTTATDEQSEWAAIGVKVSIQYLSFNQVISDCSGNSGFELCWWGGGWIYAPDYYPSGESLFASGGSFNVGDYNNTEMNSLIKATTSGKGNLTKYATYAADQLPVLYEPNPTGTGEFAKSLHCVPASACVPNPLEDFNPEYLDY